MKHWVLWLILKAATIIEIGSESCFSTHVYQTVFIPRVWTDRLFYWKILD